MQIVWRCYRDNINFGVRKHIVIAFINVKCAFFFRKIAAFLLYIVNSGNFDIFDFADKYAVRMTLRSEADYTYFKNLFHTKGAPFNYPITILIIIISPFYATFFIAVAIKLFGAQKKKLLLRQKTQQENL